VLNDLILSHIDGIAGCAILELGAGNGYFPPLLLRRFSGQAPRRVVVSDQSKALLAIAQAEFFIPDAEYLALDVQLPFPFAEATFDLILVTMLFNELPTTYVRQALMECYRVLDASGQLLATMPHPAFIHALAKKGALTDFGRGLFAMPGAEGLRLPVSRRSVEAYIELATACGFQVEAQDVQASAQVRNAKAGLTAPRNVPLALLLDCRKR
jgi:SAM-dependent methyltransferase